MTYMFNNKSYFEQKFDRKDIKFDDYIVRMRGKSSWGGFLEIEALSKLLGAHITVKGAEQPVVFPSVKGPQLTLVYTSIVDDSPKNHFNVELPNIYVQGADNQNIEGEALSMVKPSSS